MRTAKRLAVTAVAFFIAGLFVTWWRQVVPPSAFTGAVMAPLAVAIIYGAWRWSARFQQDTTSGRAFAGDEPRATVSEGEAGRAPADTREADPMFKSESPPTYGESKTKREPPKLSTPKLQRLGLGLVAFAMVAAVIFWFAHRRDEYVHAANRVEEAANIARAKAGPYLEFNKVISPTEKLSIVVIPHPWGAWADKRCLVYLNTEYRTSTMSCNFETLPPDVRPTAGLFDDIVPPRASGTRQTPRQ